MAKNRIIKLDHLNMTSFLFDFIMFNFGLNKTTLLNSYLNLILLNRKYFHVPMLLQLPERKREKHIFNFLI